MIDFKEMALTVKHNIEAKLEQHKILKVSLDKQKLKEIYLSAFPEGTNPVILERTEHDCNCCHGFLRTVGTLVYYKGDRLYSVLRDASPDYPYKQVLNAVANYVETLPVETIAIRQQGSPKLIGCATDVLGYSHFHVDLSALPISVTAGVDMNERKQQYDALKQLHLKVTKESISILLKAVEDNSIYRIREHKHSLQQVSYILSTLDSSSTEEKLWSIVSKYKHHCYFCNTMVGTLAVALSRGDDYEAAVESYLKKAYNYKETSGNVSLTLKQQFQEYLKEHDIVDNLTLVHTDSSCIPPEAIVYQESAQEVSESIMDLIDVVQSNVKPKNPISVSVDTFLREILPETKDLYVFPEEPHRDSFCSILSTKDTSKEPLFHWDNNYTLSYVNGKADALTARVKAVGGITDVPLRISLSWEHRDDLDLIVRVEGYIVINYCYPSSSSLNAYLDKDANYTTIVDDPVENIIFQDSSFIPKDTDITVKIENNAVRQHAIHGFTLGIYDDNNSYIYHNTTNKGGTYLKFKYDKEDGIYDIRVLQSTLTGETTDSQSKGKTYRLHGVPMNQFVQVDKVVFSPDSWSSISDHPHLVFLMKECKLDSAIRGLHNEHLISELRQFRKVIDNLGSKLQVPVEDIQTSGLGFSFTSGKELLVRTTGSKSGCYLVKF